MSRYRVPGALPGVLASLVVFLVAAQPVPGHGQDGSALNFSGDFRLRQESNFDDDPTPDRHRQRLRLRFNLSRELGGGLQVAGRVRTGDPGDPNSPYRDFGAAFDSADFELDRAYARWKPSDRLWLAAGKLGHPFRTNPVYGELVWDADVNPEGAVAGWSAGGLDLVVGEYTLLEQSKADEASLFVAQFATSRRFGGIKADLALGYYGYSHPTPDGAQGVLNDNVSNAKDAAGKDFASGFSILNPIVALSWGEGRPWTVAGEYVKNLDAAVDQDAGFALGLAWGSTKAPGDWQVYWQTQAIETDAAFSAFVQDDFRMATNHRSQVFGYQRRLSDRTDLHLWGLVSKLDEAPKGQANPERWRVRLDLSFKF